MGRQHGRAGAPGISRRPSAVGGDAVLLSAIIIVVAMAMVGVAVLYRTSWRNMDWVERDRDG
jgi:hypothetical protein